MDIESADDATEFWTKMTEVIIEFVMSGSENFLRCIEHERPEAIVAIVPIDCEDEPPRVKPKCVGDLCAWHQISITDDPRSMISAYSERSDLAGSLYDAYLIFRQFPIDHFAADNVLTLCFTA